MLGRVVSGVLTRNETMDTYSLADGRRDLWIENSKIQTDV